MGEVINLHERRYPPDKPFADMEQRELTYWLAWARQRDWGGTPARYVNADGALRLQTQYARHVWQGAICRQVDTLTILHETPEALMRWAEIVSR